MHSHLPLQVWLISRPKHQKQDISIHINAWYQCSKKGCRVFKVGGLSTIILILHRPRTGWLFQGCNPQTPVKFYCQPAKFQVYNTGGWYLMFVSKNCVVANSTGFHIPKALPMPISTGTKNFSNKNIVYLSVCTVCVKKSLLITCLC